VTDFPWNPDDPLARVPTFVNGNRAESLRAQAALLDYWGMGPGRSLAKLHRRYEGQHTECK